MSKIELLRLLITERLTAAAEEIFGVFGRTLAEYEEEISRSKLEIDRQRRLLDLSATPQISLRGCGPGVPSDQQDWSGVLNPVDKDPVRIKEEGSLYSDPREARSPTPDRKDVDLVSFQADPQPGPSDLRPDPLEPPLDRLAQATRGSDGAELEVRLSESVDSYVCTVCGRSFVRRHHWTRHMQAHRKVSSKVSAKVGTKVGAKVTSSVGAKVSKSYICNICGRKLSRLDGYQKHLRIHTGEKPYGCNRCGRRFSDNSNFKRHIRTYNHSDTLQTQISKMGDLTSEKIQDQGSGLEMF